MTKNPFGWIEIYVSDIARAKTFYETVLAIELSPLPMPEGMDTMQMMSFPSDYAISGCSGALVKMDGMSPGTGGTLVYLSSDDCAIEESRVVAAGGQVIQSKQSIGEYGFISLFIDTEGNTVGLHSMG